MHVHKWNRPTSRHGLKILSSVWLYIQGAGVEERANRHEGHVRSPREMAVFLFVPPLNQAMLLIAGNYPAELFRIYTIHVEFLMTTSELWGWILSRSCSLHIGEWKMKLHL